MSSDALLSTLLRVLRQPPAQQDTPRILGTISSLLVSLNNPLNVKLLVSHVVSAATSWAATADLDFCLNLMGVFHTAARRVIQRDLAEKQLKDDDTPPWQHDSREPFISLSKWISAVQEGLDQTQLPERKALILSGVLVGIHAEQDSIDIAALSSSLQESLVRNSNATLRKQDHSELVNQCILLSLTHAFPLLSDLDRAQIDSDKLLPILIHSLFFSDKGLASAYFLQAINLETVQSSQIQFNWPSNSSSFLQLQRRMRSPLIQSMPSLARLCAFAISSVSDAELALGAVDDITKFTSALVSQWRSTKISEIDATEESLYLHEESRKTTLPTLWQLLRNTLFAIVVMLSSAVGRSLADRALTNEKALSHMAAQSLQSLHNLNFIFARLSSSAFSQYTFVHLTCIDILNSYPAVASTFLRAIATPSIGSIPAHPLDRVSDLFFLNTAEHFTFALSTSDAEALLLRTASPYLTSVSTPALRPLFEAAHSVMLAVFAAPQNADLTAIQLPFYVRTLFDSFPQNLSPRQFRLAFKSLVQIASPPNDLARRQPMLPAILLDLVMERAKHSSPQLIPDQRSQSSSDRPEPLLSEQATMILALFDSLQFIDVNLLAEWLPLLSEMIAIVKDDAMRDQCISHLWEVFVSGAMDPDRSQVCVAWWTTAGGRDAVLHSGGAGSSTMMSGALPAETYRPKM